MSNKELSELWYLIWETRLMERQNKQALVRRRAESETGLFVITEYQQKKTISFLHNLKTINMTRKERRQNQNDKI